MRFHIQDQSYQFKALPFGLSTAPMEFTVVAKEVKLMALQKGIRIHQYLDDWLVRATSHQICLQHTLTLVALCRELGWLVNKEKSELESKQVFNFVGYQFGLREGKVRPTPEHWQTLTDKILSILSGPVCPVRQFMSLIGLLTATEKQVHLGQLHMRPIQRHLKNNWRVPESLEKVIPVPRSLHPHLKWWLEESNVLPGQPLPSKTCSVNLYRRIKRRVGCSLKRAHCKGNLASSRKQVTHKSPGTKSGLSGLKRVPRPLFKQHSPGSHRQHNSGCLYQQRRGDEVGLPVCPTVENPVLVHQETGNPQGTSHSGRLNVIADKLSRLGQTIQTEWSLHPEVFKAICSRWHQSQVDLFATRFNNKLPQFVSPVPDPQAWAVDALSLSWKNLDPYAFPPAAILGKVVEKLQDYTCNRIILIAPGWPNMPWFWDLVAMSSQIPPVSAQPAQSGVPTIQPDPAQELVKPEPTCLATRLTAIKEQGFSEAVAARIEAPQRGSTRSVYEAKWTIFTKWCLSNQVDFRAPPLKAIADFLLHLFQLQPSTIDGYRSAIADKLGNSTINVSKDENLIRLLDSFHRDRPKGRRGISSWNLSLVLHQLTKAPFEPLKEASLKHLTFKTVFLLALGSGKCRSEIQHQTPVRLVTLV